MPQRPKHRKMKRTVMVVKRATCATNRPIYKSYKPLCELLKSNNSALAKALSKQKRESQYLFTQNLKLVAEVQDLGLACNKRDTVLSGVLDNAKEILKMLVTMTGYVTNTISTCQKFVTSSGADMQIQSSIGSRDSTRRLSTKSPAKGVVKPMVSGHTITKPIINLNRVNMDLVNNAGSLSVIEEIRTPPRNQEANASASPVSAPADGPRWEAVRRCRMLERLTLTPPTETGQNMRRLSRRSNRHSGRLSGKHSRASTSKLSLGSPPRRSMESAYVMGSPRVQLNDVSKLLQNSQSINIRKLNETRTSDANKTLTRDSLSNLESSPAKPETPPRRHSRLSTNNRATTKKDKSGNKENKGNKIPKRTRRGLETTLEAAPDTSSSEDPLEGPSWLYKSRNPQIPAEATEYDKTEAFDETLDHEGTQLNQSEEQSTSENEMSMTDICHARPPPTAESNADERVKVEGAANPANFVTQRRGFSFQEVEEEDMDDFTLIYRQQPRNFQFDANDLKLPRLEDSAIRWPAVPEPEPEVTANIPRIAQNYAIPSVVNASIDDSLMNRMTTVHLPTLPLPIADFDQEESMNSSGEERQENSTNSSGEERQVIAQPPRDWGRTMVEQNETDFVECTMVCERSGVKEKKKSLSDKDPSSAKVVLEKLSDSEIKQRTPSPDESFCQNLKNVTYMVPARTDNSSDSESNSSVGSAYMTSRLRRKRPTSLQEPRLNRKLRRS